MRQEAFFLHTRDTHIPQRESQVLIVSPPALYLRLTSIRLEIRLRSSRCPPQSYEKPVVTHDSLARPSSYARASSQPLTRTKSRLQMPGCQNTRQESGIHREQVFSTLSHRSLASTVHRIRHISPLALSDRIRDSTYTVLNLSRVSPSIFSTISSMD
jgi:hypothetical protein